MPKSALSARPCAFGSARKAWNCLCIMEWLAHEAANAQMNEYTECRACMLWGFSKFFYLLRTCGMWMSSCDLVSLREARNAMLFCYGKLANFAEAEG
eukprot:1086751-Alexandrium_andersonii.AAC.1